MARSTKTDGSDSVNSHLYQLTACAKDTDLRRKKKLTKLSKIFHFKTNLSSNRPLQKPIYCLAHYQHACETDVFFLELLSGISAVIQISVQPLLQLLPKYHSYFHCL